MIVPSIDLIEGRAVQLVQGREQRIDAGDPRPLARRFGKVGEVAVIDLDAALGRGDNRDVIGELLQMAPCRVGGGIRDVETAIEWLDRGAQKVILGTAATPEVLAELPRERVIAALDAWDGEIVVEGWTRRTGRRVEDRIEELRDLVSGFLLTAVEIEGTMSGASLERVQEFVESAGRSRVTVAGGVANAAEIATLDRLGADAQVGMALYSGALSLAAGFAAPLESDRPDGLWPTLVCDESGVALGLTYSNLESLSAALAEERGIYWSRTRGLWRKGETSGARQTLVAVAADCDRDALRFTVRQAGPGFCHLDARTCFGEPSGLGALERRLIDRLQRPLPGSLTGRLASDPALLTEKLVEEAGELGAAAASEGRDAVVREAADTLYFALAATTHRGVSLAEVERELAARALRVRRREPRRSGPSGDVRSHTRAAGRTALMPRISPEDALGARGPAIPEDTLASAVRIVEDVRVRGEDAIREYRARFEGRDATQPLTIDRADLERALDRLPRLERTLLERAHERIMTFARAQLDSAMPARVRVPGGVAEDRIVPVRSAGCYAPGGRFPLVSSALMTATPARVAGVEHVWLATPAPTEPMLAAAAIGGADGVIAAGGAHGVAALAFGIGPCAPADVVVGPGNDWVTAAKRHLSGEVGIDMLAGPSELLVIASGDADVRLVAADLLAQAEHDSAARPMLVVVGNDLVGRIERSLGEQLSDLPTEAIARAALSNGFATVVASIEEAAELANRVAPEHLQLHGSAACEAVDALDCYGALFVGAQSGEVLGDYGLGPNHTLPTGGTARFASGLSVFSFLRRPTLIDTRRDGRTDPDFDFEELLRDTATLARMEGLEAHARAAEQRLSSRGRRRMR